MPKVKNAESEITIYIFALRCSKCNRYLVTQCIFIVLLLRVGEQISTIKSPQLVIRLSIPGHW